ncbi:phosphoribosylamine-glycine ligase [Fusarium austroafricanum]|uniref:phosphoribosylamine--glycine ligase n=1 Tax=Fusarium austroafricanum TaxID=2364996 RepID=A0A8H4KCI7_9HYPO|nr:phosphoribosylamine-glycine ligase [Fusarium austroafricanum]
MATRIPGKSFTVLVVGKGGREHALAWKLSQARSVRHVYVFPGNAGTQRVAAKQGSAEMSNLSGGNPDYRALAKHSKNLGIDLVVVGPDDDVVNGIEEYFREVDIPCFAPSRKAAELEGSKVFAKAFMSKYGIPTAHHSSFDNLEAASAYVRRVFTGRDHRIVIKTDGLAAGKGVVLPESPGEALEDLHSIISDGRFPTAGSSVVIKEYMEGYEISILTFSDGKIFFSLPAGQDHKRILEGCPFRGLLFTGVMITKSGPKVIEYNVRFGDPETQSSMLVHEDTDLTSILLSCANGTLSHMKDTIKLNPGFACNVVIASGRYPGDYETGKVVKLKSPPDGVLIFHSGTRLDDGQLITAGGRVFSVAAYGDTLEEARRKAFMGVDSVFF